ncbi:MAG TPA: FtsX-like permease family protein [Chitinophagaceae bacterium]|nr:FtsX-like permease family protein [Chitinophagaceae bacterium]
MNVASFIARRIAFNNQKSFSRFIIRLATAATALSVAAMIITISFVSGFQEAVGKKVFSFWGHLRIQEYQQDKAIVAEETPLEENDTVVKVVKSIPGVKEIQAFTTKSAVLEKNKEIEGILFKGVDSKYDFENLSPFLKEGKWPAFDDTLYNRQIAVSQPLAAKLQVKLGDTINIYFISVQNKTTASRKLQVCGIYKTGIEEFDQRFAIGDIRLLRKVNNWNDREIGGYEVFLDDYNKMDTINNIIYDKLPEEWVSRTIKEVYPYIFDWLNILNTNEVVIFAIMTVVAIINLITCLLILVLERTRMVGILKAIGSRDITIQQIFLYNSTYIAGVGILIGLVLGAGICLLQQYTGFITMNEAAYYVSVAPVKLVWWKVGAVCAATLAVCFLSLIVPTILVKTIRPIKAIQFR